MYVGYILSPVWSFH